QDDTTAATDVGEAEGRQFLDIRCDDGYQIGDMHCHTAIVPRDNRRKGERVLLFCSCHECSVTVDHSAISNSTLSSSLTLTVPHAIRIGLMPQAVCRILVSP